MTGERTEHERGQIRARWAGGAVAWAAAAVLLAGCGAGPAASAPAAPPAPRVTLTALSGQALTVPDGKPTILYFISAQCSSCVAGLHELAALGTQLPHSVQWVSVDVTPQYDSPPTVTTMMAETGAQWPAAYATNALLEAYHVTELDQLAVIGANGRLLYDGGRPSAATLRGLIHLALRG
ncbi:MAG: hypothetical protein K6U14_11925 [Firmicutes bacterium]|nr:hypothetical protein [Alicyclobacillaceae bacterium]MCL6498321.1 hypothetical protein [Bacillota bacterium]